MSQIFLRLLAACLLTLSITSCSLEDEEVALLGGLAIGAVLYEPPPEVVRVQYYGTLEVVEIGDIIRVRLTGTEYVVTAVLEITENGEVSSEEFMFGPTICAQLDWPSSTTRVRIDSITEQVLVSEL